MIGAIVEALLWNAPWITLGWWAIDNNHKTWALVALGIANLFGGAEALYRHTKQDDRDDQDQEAIEVLRRKQLSTAAYQFGSMETLVELCPMLIGEVPDGITTLVDTHRRVIERLEAGEEVNWRLEEGAAASGVDQLRAYITDTDDEVD